MGTQKLASPPGHSLGDLEGRQAGPEDLTVLICTHNKAHMLDRALERVARQLLPGGIRWEVLVVGNRCTDETAQVVRRWGESGRLPHLRYTSERRLGVSFARKRGVRESRGRLVGFVDDDCLLAPDWAAQALKFAEAYPRAGAFGSRNELVWEASPPPIAELYGESLARQDLGPEPRQMPVKQWRMPAGAGMVLRREAVRDSGWMDHGVLRSRTGRALRAGEDAEIALRIRRAGWQVWYAPTLRLCHVIPPERMTLAYLRRLHRGFGRADAYLRALAKGPQRHPRLEGLAWAAGELREVLDRYQDGYVRYEDERPTWLIRLSYARGCLEGAVLFLLTGRGW